MIGSFGDIIFETSDKRILTFTNLKRDNSTRSEKHNKIGGKPAKEFVGPDLDQISFTINFSAAHGTDPRVEMEKWLRMSRAGEAHKLIIGVRRLGLDKWTIESTSQAWNTVFNNGELYSCSVDVTLEEYLEELE